MAPHTRSRYREVQPAAPWRKDVRRPDGSIYSTEFGSSVIQTFYETIIDVIGSGDKVHPVTHDTIRVVSQPLPNWTDTSSGWSQVNSNVYEIIPSHAIEELCFDAAHIDMGELSDLAFDALVPQIPQEVSVPNFLYELREIAALIPRLEEGIVKSVSGGYLNYQFGWKPFIGDIQKLTSLMSTIRTRLEYLRDTWGKETRIGFRHEVEVDQRSGYLYRGYSWDLSGRCIFNCGGYLFHMLEDLDGLIGEFRALLGATGFNNPLGVLWEAIPFSFVVDWFSRCGSLISRTPIQPFVGPWEIRRVTNSISLHCELRGYFALPSGYSPQEVTNWKVKATFYRRDVGLPVSASILYRDGLSPQQQMLGAALIGAAHK